MSGNETLIDELLFGGDVGEVLSGPSLSRFLSLLDALLCFFFPGCLFDGTLSGIFAEFDVGSEFSDDMEPMEWSKGF